MIYIDASQLHRFLKAAKPVTGIQRLTLNSLMGLHRKLGDKRVRALVYDFEGKAFRALTVAQFFGAGKGVAPKLTARDRILFMEWFWNQDVFDAGLELGRAQGARRFRFFHDVIPVARPDFVRPENTMRFRANATRALAAADVLLTNSDYSKTDLLRHFPAAAKKPIHVLKLPHEFTVIDAKGRISPVGCASNLGDAAVRPAIAALKDQAFALMVGTLEERKNTLAVVKAWSRLVRKSQNAPKLVIVGFWSAHSLPYTAALFLRMKLARDIVHLTDCTDLELAWLYQHCRFSVYLSQYEGWGLPIGESLWFGKPVLTQKVTSLGEAGGASAHYVAAEDSHALDTALLRLAAKATTIRPRKLRRWTDFSAALAAKLRSPQ